MTQAPGGRRMLLSRVKARMLLWLAAVLLLTASMPEWVSGPGVWPGRALWVLGAASAVAGVMLYWRQRRSLDVGPVSSDPIWGRVPQEPLVPTAVPDRRIRRAGQVDAPAKENEETV